MEESSTKILEPASRDRKGAEEAEPTELPDNSDGLSVKRWLAAYIAYLLALVVPAAVMLGRMGVSLRRFLDDPRGVTTAAGPVLKLLIFAIYISLACTFFPIPTGWIVSILATRQVGLSDSLIITTLLVASVGAFASMVANLHDFHLFTLVLRHKGVARLRGTKLYDRAARWFGRRPFALLVIFNVLPIPIDVIRMLAATYRYPLRPFAAANFIGRWIRYAVIAAGTFIMGEKGWIIAAALLGVAIILAGVKIGGKLFARRNV
ncbi:MAG: VTT domain-containing protein [Planctomycetota bacterium]|nr:VTT domain-containing protein [Planctomycetota bacterium]